MVDRIIPLWVALRACDETGQLAFSLSVTAYLDSGLPNLIRNYLARVLADRLPAAAGGQWLIADRHDLVIEQIAALIRMVDGLSPMTGSKLKWDTLLLRNVWQLLPNAGPMSHEPGGRDCGIALAKHVDEPRAAGVR